LRNQIKALKDTFLALQDAERIHQLARAEEALARTNLRKQYEINYLEARKEYGWMAAVHLFPKINCQVSRQKQKAVAEIIRNDPENDTNPAGTVTFIK